MTAKLDHEVAALKRRLDEALAERDAAEARQAAMAEILEIINSSPGDLAPVFDAMHEKATRLCDAEFGTLWTYDGKRLHPAGLYRVPAGFAEFLREPIGADESAVYAAIVDGQGFVLVPDLADSDVYREGQPLRRATVDLGGARTGLAVAIRKDKTLLGIFAVYRQEVRSFSHKQIALLQNFATQAVVAMGNARLLTETREALEQQTAAAEVLQVINSSPGDLMPIFEAMVHKAIRLCDAASGTLWTYDGQRVAPAAVSGASRLAELFEQHDPSRASPDTPGGQLLAGERVVHILDVKEDPAYRAHPRFREMADVENCRTFVAVGLRKENVLLGMITVYREEVRPFSGKQIGLLQNFAEQAVIAIENARLINETREALEQQTATAEVLRVINSSPGNLAPVFNAMLEKATRLCAASFGILLNYDGQRFRHAALRGIPPAYAKFMHEHPPVYGPDSAPGRLLGGEDLVHVLDMMGTDLYRAGESNRRAIADLAGARTVVAVPLRKDDVLMGAIVVFRQEVRPFSEKQIALLENFSAQAVIAMENARLITETREALEQQTATAEVLAVINSSPGNLAPVFDAVLEKAARLCGADFGWLFVYDGQYLNASAVLGATDAYAEFLLQNPVQISPTNMHGRLMSGEPFIHIPDVSAAPPYLAGDPMQRAFVDLGHGRTVLGVPLRKDRAFLGELAIYRCEVRPFSEKQIGLLRTFAAQAEIAMENAHLITGTREALEQQTATAQVLGVINASPGDLAPVFDAIVEKAHRLCEVEYG